MQFWRQSMSKNSNKEFNPLFEGVNRREAGYN